MKQEDIQDSASDSGNTAPKGSTRRQFLLQSVLASVGLTLAPYIGGARPEPEEIVDGPASRAASSTRVQMTVNKKPYDLELDSRVTLLDALREKMHLPGTKKGCDHGQCGACTVLVNGQRINSCLTLAAMCHGATVTTIEGLANGDTLHPMQAAFIKHDAFQCGYCTPGQICSAVGLLQEGHAKTEADIQELMSGNICRCGAYQNIKDAIMEIKNA